MAKNSLAGLSAINIELTSRCNKKCWMCGRRKIERDYPDLTIKYGDMDYKLLESIAKQIPPGIVVQLHNNGEPTLYPYLGDAIRLFKNQITQFDTNGKLLLEKSDEIIDNLDTIAVSVIENDPDAEEQFVILKRFLDLKGESKPTVVARLNGDVDSKRYEDLGLIIARRLLHSPMGSFNYRRSFPTIPEIGICLDFLNHPAINKDGDFSICVRFDPKRYGVLGNIRNQSIVELWNSEKRKKWLKFHKKGQRSQIPLCSYCHYWGVPTGCGSDSESIKLP
ncbi:radical SAM/SPASM domain-containing protein [Desulfobacter curvatus]|uniref:radical SAM/SPASM domain-containing protein n=1 Tax=Desulfobacter curvatus TaxID=2290 RepID=UPI0003609DB5|nr:radical SAM/SPASM domain-containing protein [Desulfobacter curvatus]